MIINLLLLFAGILADPGIKKETYLFYTKKQFDGEKELESASQVNDIESSSASFSTAAAEAEPEGDIRPRKRKYKTVEREGKDAKNTKVLFCEKCNVDVTKGMQHCSDCNVCVYGWDHHCVFFSKCIGGGNFLYFGGAIGVLIFNFVIMFAILFCEDIEGGFKTVAKKPV